MEPIVYRLIGVTALVIAAFLAVGKLSAPFGSWQLPVLSFLLGVGAFIRAFLLEQGYTDKD